MSMVLFLSILLAAAILSTVWFWYGCRTYEEEIVYLEDAILMADNRLVGTTLDQETVNIIREEAALIREWREENTTDHD